MAVLMVLLLVALKGARKVVCLVDKLVFERVELWAAKWAACWDD